MATLQWWAVENQNCKDFSQIVQPLKERWYNFEETFFFFIRNRNSRYRCFSETEMAPKKKRGAEVTDKRKKGIGGPPPKAGAVKIHISAENEQRLRRLLQQPALCARYNPPEILSDLQKKQAAKKLRNIYDHLASEGFANSQIELGLSSVNPGEATLGMVLDSICFNVPGNELPKKYSFSGIATEDIESSSVQLLSAAKKDWRPQHSSINDAVEKGMQELVQPALFDEKKALEEMKSQADWIRQYMEERSSESSSSNDSDWEILADQDREKHRQHTEHVTDPAKRVFLIAQEFQAAKIAAISAKQEGDKERQSSLGKLICKLKEEMALLGLSEETLLRGLGSSQAKHCSPDPIEEKHGEMESIGQVNVNEPCTGNEADNFTDMVDNANTEEGLLEPEDHIFGLFDEEEEVGNLPTSILELQRKKRATISTGPISVSGQKHSSKNEKMQEVERLPKALLQQQCQKQGWDVPKYVRVSGRSDRYMYTATIARPSSGRGKGKRIGGVTSYSVPQNITSFDTVEEAQNAVATWVLFSVFPDLPLHHILPEPYRAMILQWHIKGSNDDRKEALEMEHREAFIDSLLDSTKSPNGDRSADYVTRDISLSKSLDLMKEIVETDACQGINVSESEENEESRVLLLKYQEKMKTKSYMEHLHSRKALPIFSIKDLLINEIQENEVVVVSGETGSGKTTQVPQYILEDFINNNKGAVCSIICTQPRRLAAISIAQRVATEQGDAAPGSSGSMIGYQVRLDSAWNDRTKLLFCTTGILLRRLAVNEDNLKIIKDITYLHYFQGDRMLRGVSHVIVDEVHERSILGDFILIILKNLIERRRTAGHCPLKVILMSATVDATLFSNYFWNCPIVNVEGRTFPVETMYLEDIYEMLNYQLALDSPAALSSDPIFVKKKLTSGRKKKVSQLEWEDPFEDSNINPFFDESLYRNYGQRTKNNLLRLNEDAIDLDLLEDLVIHIDKTSDNGAILVFLSGIGDILSLTDRLCASEHFSGVAADWILPLHSSLSVVEQQKVFKVPPAGVRKVVVTTNIAETSITIEDVVFVIDSGKHKEIQYDPRRGMSRMMETWISQANAKQRCGRAGRVKSGYCFCLYTRFRFENLLRPFQVPEMLRVPLVELCLQIKFLALGDIRGYLLKALDSPTVQAIESAIATLHEVGALDKQEELTNLGFHLAKLPVDVHIGKMMLYGTILGCLSPILTIAACLSYKSPFLASHQQAGFVDRVKRELATVSTKSNELGMNLCSGQQSDQLVMATAYDNWNTVVKKFGRKSGYEYCKANCLSVSTLNMLRDMRSQFAFLLADIGFISLGSTGMPYNLDELIDDYKLTFNRHSHIPSIVKATICAGLYPKVAKMEEESIRIGYANAAGKAHWSDGQQEVFIHPSSVNHNLPAFQHPFLVFHEKVKTNKVFVRDTTVISPCTLLLFGGEISVQHQEGKICVDGWLKINAPAQIAVLLKKLRATLDIVLEEMMSKPKDSSQDSFRTVISSTVKLLVDEGSTV